MSVIFPGNYVAHLNAYRDQGVFAIPGVEFYQVRGAAIVSSTVTANAGLTPVIPSPDLRQDDRPRLDKPLTIPAGAKVYRTAISTSNLATTGTSTVSVDGLTSASLEASLAAVGGVFSEAGDVAGSGLSSLSTEGSDATITIANSGDLTVIDPDSQAAVIVEVCYYIDADGPTTDDINLPYKTDAGQGY